MDQNEEVNRRKEIRTLSADWKIPDNYVGGSGTPDKRIRSRWSAFSPNQIQLNLDYGHSTNTRKIPKSSWACIPTHEILDDFYLNLLDWSRRDLLAVAAPKEIHVCNPSTRPRSDIRLRKFIQLDDREDVCSITFDTPGDNLAVGTKIGIVNVYDTQTGTKTRSYQTNHTNRVAALAWNENGILACGTRDKNIIIRDARIQDSGVTILNGHTQEVCGLKWSPHDANVLASGGNDNSCLIWRLGNSAPEKTLVEHNAAVKAIAWSPHDARLIATGGGTNDRCIKVFDVKANDSTSVTTVDTESQVCNLFWSSNCNELVSSHGYTLHQLVAWEWKPQEDTIIKQATLSGHTMRVLYLAPDPNGEEVATAAADRHVRIWHIFPPKNEAKKCFSEIEDTITDILCSKEIHV